MKKQLIRILSSALAVMTVMSTLTCLPTFAAIKDTGANVELFQVGNNYATGELEPEPVEYSRQIETVEQYKKNLLAETGSAGVATLPESVDNSSNENGKYFPEIDNQGDVGSCTAWANGYYQFTYTMNKSLNRVTTPENTFNPMWIYTKINYGIDKGSVFSNAYDFLSHQGALQMQTMPLYKNGIADKDYLTWHASKEYWEKASDYRLKSFNTLALDTELIKTALANGEILTFSSYIGSWNFRRMPVNTQFPENMKYHNDFIAIYQNGKKGAHRMTIVGYNDNIWTDVNCNNYVDDGEMGAFKIANSWGKEWYDSNDSTKISTDGFTWVAYDAINSTSFVENGYNQSDRLGIFDYVSRITVDDEDSDSDINLVYTANTSDREQFIIKVEATNGIDTYTGTISPYADTSKPQEGPTFGNWSFSGTTEASDGTMTYPLDNVVPDLNSDNFDDYIWNVTVKDSTYDNKSTILKDLYIEDVNTGKIYKSDLFTTEEALNGHNQIYDFHTNKAFIYYNGCNKPNISYTLDNQTTPTVAKMTEASNIDFYPYTYVIDLGNSNSAKVSFIDENGIEDNCSGSYYTVNAGKNIVSSLQLNSSDVEIDTSEISSAPVNIGVSTQYKFNLSGGYTPYYRISYSIDNLDNPYASPAHISGEGDSVRFFLREVGLHKLTIAVTDSKYRTSFKTVYINAIDQDIKFTNVSEPKNARAHEEITFNIATLYERAYPENKATLTVTKSGQELFKQELKSIKRDMGALTAKYEAKFTPETSGKYTAKWTVVDSDNRTVTKTFTFNVSADEKIHIKLTSGNFKGVNINACESYTFESTGGSGEYTYSYACSKLGDSNGKTPTIINNGSKCLVYFREAGENQLIITVTDSYGNKASTAFSVFVEDNKIEVVSATASNSMKYTTMVFKAYTRYEAIPYPSYKNSVNAYIWKDGQFVTSLDVTIGNKNIPYLEAEYSAVWTPCEYGNYMITWHITDSNGKTAYSKREFKVFEDLMPSCPSYNENDAIYVNDKYTYTFNTTGGNGKYTYDYSVWCENNVKALSPDLEISNNSCSLTFKETGTYNVVVRATDSFGNKGSKYFTFNVNPLITISSAKVSGSAYLGSERTFTATTSNEIIPYESYQNPVKLTIMKDDKIVATPTVEYTSKNILGQTSTYTAKWTPERTGKYTYIWEITDYKNHTALYESTFTSNISINLLSGSLQDVNIGTRQTYQFQGIFGNGDYTYKYTVIGNTNTSDRKASLFPNGDKCNIYFYKTGYQQLNVVVTDSFGNTCSHSFFIYVVDNPVTISDSSFKVPYLGQKTTFTVSTQYEAILYPTHKNDASLTIKKDGVTVATPEIEYVEKNMNNRTAKYRASWVPTSSGKYTANWSITDAKGLVATKTITFYVNVNVVLTCNAQQSVNINTKHSYSFGASGLKGDYTYEYHCDNVSNTSYTAPIVTNNGSYCDIIFKSAGTHRLTAIVTDSKGNSGTKTIFITVKDNPLVITSFSSTTGTINQPMTFSMSTQYETIPDPSFLNNVSLTIQKNGTAISTPLVNCTSRDMDKLLTGYSATWTPTEAGTYVTTFKVTDTRGRSTSRVLYFKVS